MIEKMLGEYSGRLNTELFAHQKTGVCYLVLSNFTGFLVGQKLMNYAYRFFEEIHKGIKPKDNLEHFKENQV